MTQIIINILIAIYNGIIFLHIPYALAFSIIGLTILIRLALYPLISSQLKASKKMQDLNPHLKKLKDTHKNDAKRLQQETLKLYKEHGVNPAAGCLPVIIQLPIIWGLYSVLQEVVKIAPDKVVSEVNRQIYPALSFLKISSPWDPTFLGLPLGKTPAQLFSTMAAVAILVPVITGFFQFIQSKMMFSPAPKKEGEKDNKKDDFASVFQSQSMYIFPIMIGFFSYTFPIGLSLYWNTFTIFGIIQQYRIAGLGGLSKWVEKIYGKK